MAVRPLHPPPAGRCPTGFLYTQYIQSYIDAMPMDAADEYHHDLVKNECTPDLWTDIEAIRAFAAAHAFLLGLRTGRGLPL